MDTFKIICVALLCAAATANPVEDTIETNDHDCCEPKLNLDWWENAVFYQIYPRSFKDSNGDGIGDIQGIIEKWDYLVELGVNAVWLSPIFKSPMKDFGYDISNFYEIDPIFGSMADLEALFKKANETGIKVILDFVPNHTSDEHDWFKKSVKNDKKYADYYIWAKGKSNNTLPPNNWVSVFSQSAWTYNEERKMWYLHQFTEQQPDLNFRNKEVVSDIIKVLEFWLAKGAAGFRVDAFDTVAT